MLLNNLKDVSSILAIVFAVRTSNITQHLQAERQMLKLIFAFDRMSYARCNSFQHLFLNNLSKDNPRVFNDLLKYGFEATSLSETFSRVHGE